jgi:FolB domain-containing protein
MITSHITLHQLKFSVHLGWPSLERSQPQMVWVDIRIHFPEPPLACVTDNIEDTFCYDTLIKTLKTQINLQQFHLLEHLGFTLYQMLKKMFPPETQIAIRVKKDPIHYIPDLTQGVTFTYGDNNLPW